MAQAELVFSAILLLGALSAVSARTVYAENYDGFSQAHRFPHDPSQMQQEVQSYGHQYDAPQMQEGAPTYIIPRMNKKDGYSESAQRLQHEMLARNQEYDMEIGIMQDVYLMEEEERCLGEHKSITNLPLVRGEMCSVTQDQCGWVKLSIMKYHVRFGGRGQLNADMRVCQSKFSLALPTNLQILHAVYCNCTTVRDLRIPSLQGHVVK